MSTPAARRGISVVSLLVMLSLVAVGVGGFYYYRGAGEEGVRETELIIRPVTRGQFDHVVLEEGEIESSSNTEIICNVKSRGGNGGTAILWVIDEGTAVEKGEKLVELDSSQLETEMKQQKILVSNAQAALSSAEALYEQAKIAREEYLQGTYLTEKKTIEGEIAVAEQELRKAELNLRSTERMVAKGLVNSLQMKSDEFGVVNARSVLEAAEARLSVLENLTRQKMLVQFDSDIEAAQAGKEAARSTLLEEQEKLADLEQQIKSCIMYAPAAGVVVHCNEYSRRGGSEFVVEPGAIVRERQAIIQLPDPSKMQVTAKINESRITLVREGMPARIRVNAAAGMELIGRVKKVNRYAEPGSWFSSSIKEYACAIEIIDPPDGIRTGMTSEVRIFVEQRPDALQMPVQAIYEHHGETFTLVRTPQKKFETRQIEIGATNDSMATVESGLEEGERVVLNLRSHLNLMDLPTPEETSSESLEMQLASHPSSGAAADGPSDAGAAASDSRPGQDAGAEQPTARPGEAGADAVRPAADSNADATPQPGRFSASERLARAQQQNAEGAKPANGPVAGSRGGEGGGGSGAQ